MATVCRICKRGISNRGRTAIYCDTCTPTRVHANSAGKRPNATGNASRPAGPLFSLPAGRREE